MEAQHFDIQKIIFDNIEFENTELNSLYKKNIEDEDVELFLRQALSKFKRSEFSQSDEIAYNVIKSYNFYNQNVIFESLKFNLLNEKNLKIKSNPQLELANQLILALIYEKKEILSASIDVLKKLNSSKAVENFQIQFFKGCLQQQFTNYQASITTFEQLLPISENISEIDHYYTLIHLSEVSDELQLYKKQLHYALLADSVLNYGKSVLFNSDIYYKFSKNNNLFKIDDLRKLSLINLSVAYRKNNLYKQSLNTINKLIDLEKKSPVLNSLAMAYVSKALTYTFLKDYNNASSSYSDALKIYDKENNLNKKSETYNLLAKNSYLSLDFSKTIKYCESSIDISKKNNDNQNLAASYFILSQTYAVNGDLINAQKNYNLYIEIKNLIEKQTQIDMALALKKSNELKLIEKKAETSLIEIEKEQLEVVNSRIIAEQKEKELLLLKKDNELKEKDLVNQKLEKDQALKSLQLIKQQLEQEQLKKKYVEINKEREIKNLESKDNENKIKLLNAQKKIYLKENEIKTQELSTSKNRQKLFLLATLIMFVFVTSLIFFLIKVNKQKKTIEGFNKTIQQTNQELETNIKLVTEQSTVIDTKNKQILSSINYSERIQNAFLLTQAQLNTFFKESFVIFLPKEIVSGDFYLVKQRKNEVIIAMVDCTGHGVPGAMISAIAYQEITHLIDTENYSMGELLDELNNRINKMLNSNSSIGTDGMDISILALNSSTKTIHYAGAKGTFLIASNSDFTEVKTDRQSIGQDLNKEMFKFSTNCIQYNEGDLLYLFTDGYADQFSVIDNKRIGTKKFKNLLQENSKLSLEKQKNEIEKYLFDNKKDSLQTDDISILAIKL